MTLGVDLASSWAKVDRAEVLLEILNRELRESLHTADPYTIISDFNPKTGWLAVKLKPKPADLRFSVLLGELIHNLRSALDHAVAALLEVSGSSPTTFNQFPIYIVSSRFDKRVGTAAKPLRDLAGLKHGFDEIRRVQPFNLQPDPSQSALALLQRLSNSDKHRAIILFAGIPESHQIRVSHNGTIMEVWQPPGPLDWHPDIAVEILGLRFAEPYPTKMDPEADLVLGLWFSDRAFPPDYPDDVFLGLEVLQKIGIEVTTILARPSCGKPTNRVRF